MSAASTRTTRKVPIGGVVLHLSDTDARKVRRELPDEDRDLAARHRPLSVAQYRRQRDADEASAEAESLYGVRVTG